MKKLLMLAIVVLSAITLYSQDDEIKEFQEAWGKDKKELVALGMALSRTDSVKFWPVYNQYEKERKKIGRDRILIIDDYADNYFDITNAKADELVNRIFKNDAALAKLQQTYYTKVKTALGAKQAAKFIHIESYINTTIKARIQEAVPVIGELDGMKAN